MDHSVVVSEIALPTSRLSDNFTSEQETCNASFQQSKNASISQQTSHNSLQIVRQSFESQDLTKSAIDIAMHSWRDSKKQHYWSYVQKWMRFCTEKHAGPMASSVKLVLEYLASLFHAGIGYIELNTA